MPSSRRALAPADRAIEHVISQSAAGNSQTPGHGKAARHNAPRLSKTPDPLNSPLRHRLNGLFYRQMIHAHRHRPNRRDRNPPGFPAPACGSMPLMSPDDLVLPDRRAGEVDQVHVSSIILDVPFEFSPQSRVGAMALINHRISLRNNKL